MGDYTKQNSSIIEFGERKGKLEVLGFGRGSIMTWIYSRPGDMTLYVPFSFGDPPLPWVAALSKEYCHVPLPPGDLCLC